MKEKKISIRVQLIAAVFFTMLPITLVFYFFIGRAVTQMNEQIASANSNTLRGYRMLIQDEVAQIDSFLYGFLKENEPTDGLNELFLEEQQLNLSAAVLASAASDQPFVCSFHPALEYPDAQKKELEALLEKYRKEVSECQGWFTIAEKGSFYMIRIIKTGDTQVACMLDLQNISKRAQMEFGLESPVVFINKGREVITTAAWVRKIKEGKIEEFSEYFIIEGENPYMVVQESLLGMKILYGVRYQNHIGILKWLRMGPLLFLTSVIVLLVLLFIYMRYSFFRPLADLVGTMRKIEADDLQCRTGRYTSREFAQVNDTFNSMINTITNLKIESYEKELAAREAELAAQKSELTSLRMQIHPHFYLNCLKNIYGLAQMGEFQEIQDEILLLSKHLRYIFGLKGETVPLKKELKMCENYVQLQAIGRRDQSECRLDIPLDLLELPVPPVSILSLVENSVKHGKTLDKELVVTIKGSILMMEDGKLVDLKISDNGPGFPSDMMGRMNKGEQPEASGEHVGLWNVIQRFRILYGDKFAMNFWNSDGANIEVMIQL
ncbi:MAG: sensor histidine kinase [Lachnospiraceae bacterium]